MKFSLLFLTLFFTSSSFATCFDSNLRVLAVNGRPVAQIVLSENTVSLLNGNAKIMGISTTRSNSYESRELCGFSIECGTSELLDIELLEDPQAVVVIQVKESSESLSQVFKLSNFIHVTNSCGRVIEPMK